MGAVREETKLEFPSDREIVLTREVGAPPAMVWKAWTDPKHLAKWWGPAGFSTTTRSMEVRPGGEWRYVMHGPDGHDYENQISFLEVDPPRKLVYKHGGEMECEPVNFETTATFEAVGAGGQRTRVRMHSVFPSKDAMEFVIREYGAAEGGKQHLARLDEYVGAMDGASNPPEAFVISRVIRAPRERVWRAWTSADELMRWFGPAGTTMPRPALDLRIGGVMHYCMKMAQGEHWGRWVFREIREPELLEFVVSFADASGKSARAFFDRNWPLDTFSRVTFAEHAGIGRGTVVTIHWEPEGATESERATFAAGHEGMRAGWGGTLDRLEEHCRLD